jgi:hypothetical protein
MPQPRRGAVLSLQSPRSVVFLRPPKTKPADCPEQDGRLVDFSEEKLLRQSGKAGTETVDRPIAAPVASPKVPPRGLEASSATSYQINNLGHSPSPGDAQSGAVAAEVASVPLTPEVLAAALLGLSPADRARLAALLLGSDNGGGPAGAVESSRIAASNSVGKRGTMAGPRAAWASQGPQRGGMRGQPGPGDGGKARHGHRNGTGQKQGRTPSRTATAAESR